MTIVYADGGAEQATVELTDWRVNRPAAGSSTAFTLPYHACPDGPRCHEPVSLYVTSVAVDAGREVAGVILPRLSPSPAGPVATMHVLAAALRD